jgi:DNA polymerase theta
MVASIWLDIDERQVQDSQRNQVKKLMYGLIYGQGSAAIANDINCSIAEATNMRESFLSFFSGVKDFISRTISECKTHGYVKSLFGRKRYVSNIHSSIQTEKLKAERQAINTICQGSAADLVKKSMILVDKMIKSTPVFQEAMMTLQIHDELLFEVPSQIVSEFAVF